MTDKQPDIPGKGMTPIHVQADIDRRLNEAAETRQKSETKLRTDADKARSTVNADIDERLRRKEVARKVGTSETSEISKAIVQGANLQEIVIRKFYPGKQVEDLTDEEAGRVAREVKQIQSEGDQGLGEILIKGTKKFESDIPATRRNTGLPRPKGEQPQ